MYDRLLEISRLLLMEAWGPWAKDWRYAVKVHACVHTHMLMVKGDKTG